MQPGLVGCGRAHTNAASRPASVPSPRKNVSREREQAAPRGSRGLRAPCLRRGGPGKTGPGSRPRRLRSPAEIRFAAEAAFPGAATALTADPAGRRLLLRRLVGALCRAQISEASIDPFGTSRSKPFEPMGLHLAHRIWPCCPVPSALPAPGRAAELAPRKVVVLGARARADTYARMYARICALHAHTSARA